MIRWEFPPTCCATLRIRNLAVIEAVEVDLDPASPRSPARPGRGSRSWSRPSACCSGGRASADLVRTGDRRRDHRGGLRAAGRPRGADPARDHRRRPQPVVRRRRAGHRRMLRDVSADLVELHGQHEHQSCSIPPRISASSMPTPVSRRRPPSVAAMWARVRELPGAAGGRVDGRRERAARLELVRFQLGEIDAVKPVAGEDDELEATRRVLANAERVGRAVPAAPTTSCTTTSARRSRSWAASGRRSRSWRRSTPRSRRTSSARAAVKAQLEDLGRRSCAAYADGVDASPARLQEVEDRLARLERLKRKYGPALDGRAWPRGRAPRRRGAADRRRRAGRRSRTGSWRPPTRRLP